MEASYLCLLCVCVWEGGGFTINIALQLKSVLLPASDRKVGQVSHNHDAV